MGKGKGMNGGVREGNGLGEMVQFFFIFSIYLLIFFGGGKRDKNEGGEGLRPSTSP